MQPQRDIFRKKPADQEQTLLDLANRLPGNWCAAHIHLSRISAVKRNENIVFALQMFENSVRALDGRLLVLKNGDWIYFYSDGRMTQANIAVTKLRRLFAGDPLYYNEEKYEADFATWYDLSRDREALIGLAEAFAGKPAAVPAAEAAPAPPVLAPVEAPAATRSSELLMLAQTMEAIERANLAAFLRRQPVCTLSADGGAQWLFDEFYFSIVDLEISLNRSPLMTGDPIFLQYVTKCLDKKLVALLKPACQSGDKPNLSLNLNVASVLSPEFTDFDAATPPEAKQTIGLEFQFVDVFSDLGMFLYVRGLLRERGYHLLLDGLTDANLPFVDADRLGVDALKVRWTANLIEAGRREFAEAIRAASPERVVLCRCDSAAAVMFGQELGVTMFQGRHISERLANRAGRATGVSVFSLQQ